MTLLRVAEIPEPGADPVIRLADPPDIPAGAALITVLACALDAEDVRLAQGGAPAWPLRPGRHFVGVIEALGSGLTEDATGNRLRPGIPVLAPSLIPCGRCASCRHPPRHAPGCLFPRRLGTEAGPSLLSGGLADAVLLPAGAIHALPITLPPWIATLAEPFADALHALGRVQAAGRLPPGATTVVIGRDAAALLFVVAALALGAGRVIVLGGPEAPFLRLARQCGAEATIDATDTIPEAERIAILSETIGGRGADLTVVTEPTPSATVAGMRALGPGGTLIAATPSGSPAAWAELHARQLGAFGIADHVPDDIPVALGLLYRIRTQLPLAALHTRFPMTPAGLRAAFDAVACGACPRALVVTRPDLAG